MATILDYMAWRGDITFTERPFNEVDNLVLSELAYFHFDDLRPAKGTHEVTLQDAYALYCALESPRQYNEHGALTMLKACAASERFQDVRIRYFLSITDEERQLQFAAVTFFLPDGSAYVAFRGTDNTIIGWREDFNFTFMNEVPAQAEAVKYLDFILDNCACPVRVGGHSKGGNLAIYASAFCNNPRKGDIVTVYSNDGPGFNEYIAASDEYRQILPRVRLIIPEASIIGIIFANNAEKKIVKSTAGGGAKQHSLYTWMIECDHFVQADRQTSSSIMLDETLNRWLDSLDVEQKKAFVASIFDVMQASGATTLNEINENKLISYNAILKAAAAQSSDKKNNFIHSMLALAQAGKDVILDEGSTAAGQFASRAKERFRAAKGRLNHKK